MLPDLGLMHMPDWLPRMQQLKHFSVSHLKLDTFPGELLRLTKLECLSANAVDAKFTADLVGFAQFPYFTVLSLGLFHLAPATTLGHRNRSVDELQNLHKLADHLER